MLTHLSDRWTLDGYPLSPGNSHIRDGINCVTSDSLPKSKQQQSCWALPSFNPTLLFFVFFVFRWRQCELSSVIILFICNWTFAKLLYWALCFGFVRVGITKFIHRAKSAWVWRFLLMYHVVFVLQVTVCSLEFNPAEGFLYVPGASAFLPCLRFLCQNGCLRAWRSLNFLLLPVLKETRSSSVGRINQFTNLHKLTIESHMTYRLYPYRESFALLYLKKNDRAACHKQCQQSASCPWFTTL